MQFVHTWVLELLGYGFALIVFVRMRVRCSLCGFYLCAFAVYGNVPRRELTAPPGELTAVFLCFSVNPPGTRKVRRTSPEASAVNSRFFRSLPSHATLELLHAPHSGTMGPVSLEFGCPAVQHFPNYSHRRYQGIGTRTGADPPAPHPEATPAGRELTAPRGSVTFAPRPTCY